MSEVKTNRTKNLVIAALVVAVLGLGAYFIMSGKNSVSLNSSKKVSSDKYQAVFLTNGQVYFGKFQDDGGNYVKLTDIFYLQAKDQAVQPKEKADSSDQSNLTLIKLGKELHAPADEMNISRQQVLFWEDITKDGKVMKAIEEYKSNNK